MDGRRGSSAGHLESRAEAGAAGGERLLPAGPGGLAWTRCRAAAPGRPGLGGKVLLQERRAWVAQRHERGMHAAHRHRQSTPAGFSAAGGRGRDKELTGRPGSGLRTKGLRPVACPRPSKSPTMASQVFCGCKDILTSHQLNIRVPLLRISFSFISKAPARKSRVYLRCNAFSSSSPSMPTWLQPRCTGSAGGAPGPGPAFPSFPRVGPSHPHSAAAVTHSLARHTPSSPRHRVPTRSPGNVGAPRGSGPAGWP